MIQLNKNYSLPDALADTVPVKVVSVGGAGLNALDRIVLDGLEKASVVAINTDVQSLTSSVAAHKVQLGRTRTRGLGTGGDPELGYEAAVESADEIREALTDTRMVFVCAGLGGGTGSGAAPYVAHLAREAGALVIAFVTLPFTFEGKRRATQAREALGRLNEIAHSVICFENDRMGDLVAPQAGIHHAFAMADTTISTSVQSDSDNRAHDALTQALKNPLMDRGRMLADATNVLVQVSGGAGMTLSEVEVLMQELGRHVNEQTQILFGAVVDGKLGDRLTVTIISSLAADEDLISESRDGATLSNVFAQPPVHEQHPPPQIHIEPEAAMEPVAHEESISFEQPVAAQATPAAESMPGESEPLPVTPHKKAVPHTDEKAAAKSVPAKQEILQFEPVTRGRFEKSEPTIVEGEDLDVPTYLRKNIKVK